MWLFTDPICSTYKEEHLNFNRTLISIFKNHKIEYGWTGDKKYGKTLFKSENIYMDVIEYKQEYSLSEALRRYFHIFKTIKKNKNSRTTVFLSFDNTLFPLFCIFLSPVLARNRFICVVHNNISTLNNSYLRKFLFIILGHLLQIKFIVLTNCMKSHADFLLNKSTILLHHPFYPATLNKTLNPDACTFLSIGRQAAALYNTGSFNDLITTINDYLKSNQKKIRVIIGLSNEVVHPQIMVNENLTVEVVPDFISTNNYLEYFCNADFVVFPYSADSNYRASGTLMDAMSSGSIFIGPNIGHFKEFEGCGILYEKGGLNNGIVKALNFEESDIKTMKLNIQRKRELYEAENQKVIEGLLAL